MEVENKYCDYNLTDNGFTAIEGDTFPKDLEKSVDKIIRNEGYNTYNVIKRQISTEGGNYLGILYEVDVKGKTNEGINKETNIFIKNILPNKDFKMLDITKAYSKEVYVYKELSRIFTELQDDAKVPIKDRYNMAKCFRESNSEAIMLENLNRNGFTTGHRMDVMSLQFAELSIKELAKFHGLSYVLQNRRPAYFDRELRSMKQPFYCDDEWNATVSNICQTSSQPLGYSEKKKIDKFISTFLEKFPLYMGETSLKGCCVCHGDYRPNNILLKEIDGEIQKLCVVDYQLLYYGCPLNDFMYFIFTGTDQEFRKHHMTNLKDLYYDTLDQFLRYFDMKVENIYPREEFEKQYRERLDYGLMIGLFVMPFIFADENDVPDFTKNENLTKTSISMNSRYEERISGIVDDFIQWGYL